MIDTRPWLQRTITSAEREEVRSDRTAQPAREERLMPIYEYRCPACGKKSSRIWMRLPAAAEEAALSCPACGTANLARLLSRFSSPKSEERRLESLVDDSSLAGLDENDPRGMARLMRRMSDETGEPIDGEDGEMLERMEAGEMPPEDESGDTPPSDSGGDL
jgi:putative FmdB family regulatory protein